MKIPSTAIRSHSLHISSILFILPLFLLLMGCGSKGVFVQGTLAVGTRALTTSDGDTSNYTQVFVPDPSLPQTKNVSFTIGLNQIELLSSTDSSLSYIIFDTGVSTPNTITLNYTANNAPTLGSNPAKPSNGVYDTVQFQVTFYELTVPTVSGANHKARLGLASYTLNNNQQICQNDILLDLLSLDPTTGQSLTGTRTCSILSGAYQLPVAQLDAEFPTPILPPSGDPYVFTVPLPSPITIIDSTENVTIELEFGIDKIFFFDDTNNNGYFDPFDNCPATSCDGRLISAGRPAPNGNGSGQSAQFWLGFPTVSANSPQSAPVSTTTTTPGATTTTTTTTSTTTTT